MSMKIDALERDVLNAILGVERIEMQLAEAEEKLQQCIDALEMALIQDQGEVELGGVEYE